MRLVSNASPRAPTPGVKYATSGCMRTTNAATGLISHLPGAGDPLTDLIVSSAPSGESAAFDPSLSAGPKPYLPDLP